jgi:lipoprotein-releasing system permease protein
MLFNLNFFIAIWYLRAINKEKFISVTTIFSLVGIMLGVATLIIVMSVMNGFRDDLINRILGINSHITIYSNNLTEPDKIINLLKTDENILHINKSIESQAMIMANKKAIGVIVKGIDETDLKNKNKIYNTLTIKPETFNDNEILIGKNLASKLNLIEGEEIKLISPDFNSTIVTAVPRVKTYKVVGIFSSGLFEYDNAFVFIPLQIAKIHFKYEGDKVGNIEIYLKDVKKTQQSYKKIYDVFKQNNIYNTQIVDWQKSNGEFIGALEVERNVMFLILMLIILVATFNIISSLTMLVNDKIQQIALLRTIGLTKRDIMQIFFICGTIIGSIGTFLGFILGILVSTNLQNIRAFLETNFCIQLFPASIYFLTEIPSQVVVSDVIGIISISLFLSFLSTLYPAYKAAKTNPAEVLRYQ